VKNTAQAVIIDLGEANDIHPRNKRDVAERLARLALTRDYGFDKIPSHSPEFKALELKDGKAVIRFDSVGTGLRTVESTDLKGFAICGEDKKWVWATATFLPGAKKDAVEVSSPQVAKPVAVRYAWADNPVCNLYTIEGLPVTPFRTDTPQP
jgi:sialate O-acetylesterase